MSEQAPDRRDEAAGEDDGCHTCGIWEQGSACEFFDRRECNHVKFMFPRWTPKAAPQPAPALPTLVEVDCLIDTLGRDNRVVNTLRSLRPLVEAEECKAAIEAAGCAWKHYSDGFLWVERIFSIGRSTHAGHRCSTWPEARRWAEEQQAKREAEEWSKHIDAGWTNAEFVRVATVLGCVGFGWKMYNRTWLGGVAYGKGRFNVGTERIWLGDGPMPEVP